MYPNEQELVADFLSHIVDPDSPWAVAAYIEQFDYASGRTDVVAVDDGGGVVAFEAKLKTWRSALDQAYRSRAFAHRSYVVLPIRVAEQAMRFEPEFRRRGVGICAMSDDGLVEALASESVDPLLSWLSDRARETICDSGEGTGVHGGCTKTANHRRSDLRRDELGLC